MTRRFHTSLFVCAAAALLPLSVCRADNIVRLNVNSSGQQSTRGLDNFTFSVSRSGDVAAFVSSGDDLVANDTFSTTSDIFYKSRSSGAIVSPSVAFNSQSTTALGGALSRSGQYLVYFAVTDSNALPPFEPPASSSSNYGLIFLNTTSGLTKNIAVTSSGAPLNAFNPFFSPSVSDDGRFVSFTWGGTSAPTPLIAGVAPDIFHVYSYELDSSGRVTDAILVDKAPDGTPGNSPSSNYLNQTMSADGRFIAFMSSSSNLVANDTNGKIDVFLFDRTSNKIERISVASNGDQSNDDSFLFFVSEPNPVFISDDGRYVAFYSNGTNLAPGDSNASTYDVYIRDRVAGTTERSSLGSDGVPALYGDRPSMSSDGRYLLFFAASIAVEGVSGPYTGYVLRDRVAGRTIRAPIRKLNGEYYSPETFNTILSGDGSHILFASGDANLVPNDTNNSIDLFSSEFTFPAASAVLVPGTKLLTAPAVTVQNRKVTVQLQPFSSASKPSKRLSRIADRVSLAAALKLEVSYELKLSSTNAKLRRDLRSRTSKRALVTFNNLPPGNYQLKYRALATAKGGSKPTFTTNFSPAASFTVR